MQISLHKKGTLPHGPALTRKLQIIFLSLNYQRYFQKQVQSFLHTSEVHSRYNQYPKIIRLNQELLDFRTKNPRTISNFKLCSAVLTYFYKKGYQVVNPRELVSIAKCVQTRVWLFNARKFVVKSLIQPTTKESHVSDLRFRVSFRKQHLL